MAIFALESRSSGRPHRSGEPRPCRLFRLAAYVLALISPKYEAANLWLTLPAAIAAAALAALVIGSLVVRTAGVYFIMVTLAFAQMLYAIFHDTKIAGGSDGIYILVRPALAIAGYQAARSRKPSGVLLSDAFDVDRGVRVLEPVTARALRPRARRHTSERSSACAPSATRSFVTSSAPSCSPARLQD